MHLMLIVSVPGPQFVLVRVDIEVLVSSCPNSLPITAALLDRAEHSKPIQKLLETLVEPYLIASWAWRTSCVYPLDAPSTEAPPTSGDLEGLTKDQQTDWAARL